MSKAISTALKAHVAQDATTLAMIVKLVRQDGQIFGFTSASDDIVYLGVTYSALTGHTPSNIKNTSALNVDNLEIVTVLSSSSFVESEMMAGLWDYAAVDINYVNYTDLTMGTLWSATGKLGQLTSGRVQFTAEMRGLTQNLQQVIGRMFSPSCDANLGDARCGVIMTPYTVTGSVTSTIDQHSFVDTARIETNSTITKAIQNIGQYNAVTLMYNLGNPTVIQANGHGLSSGQQITVQSVAGLTQINGITATISFIDVNTFSMAIDSSVWNAWNGVAWYNPAYAPNPTYVTYIGGGSVTLTVPSEYFQGGKLTWLTGANAGLVMEVKSYHPNYIYLAEAMTNTIAIGDTYSLTAGCDKIAATCNGRFSNIVNFRGFNMIPGSDAMIAGA